MRAVWHARRAASHDNITHTLTHTQMDTHTHTFQRDHLRNRKLMRGKRREIVTQRRTVEEEEEEESLHERLV